MEQYRPTVWKELGPYDYVPLGWGVIDYPAIRALLRRIGYEGFTAVGRSATR